MNGILPPDLIRQDDDINGAFVDIQQAFSITNRLVTDRNCAYRAECLFNAIKILCLTNRDKIDRLVFLARQIAAGADAAKDYECWPLVDREIEYVREELRPFFPKKTVS